MKNGITKKILIVLLGLSIAGLAAFSIATQRRADAAAEHSRLLDESNARITTYIEKVTKETERQDEHLTDMTREVIELTDWRQKIVDAAEADGREVRKARRRAKQDWGTVYVIPEANENDVAEIERVAASILHFVKKAPRRKLAKDEEYRWAFARDLYNAATLNNIPHILLSIQVFRESSYRTTARNPAKGEFGLSQVHGKAAKSCDLETRVGQLQCGAKWLAKAHANCGTWEGALTQYASGYCTTSSQETRAEVLKRISKWMHLEATL